MKHKDKNCKCLVSFANATEVLVEIANELKVRADGWAQIAPLGDFPGMALTADGQGGLKKVPAIQRIDAQAVANLVNSYAETRGGLTRFLKGAPIYNGHPDVPGYEKRYPDKSPKGVFAAVKDGGADGFLGEPIFTNEGEQLIATKKVRGLSGRWSAEEIGEENGVKIYRPKEFISAGLTDRPNLPVQLLNEKDFDDADASSAANHKNTNAMKKKMIALLAALSLKPTFANAEEPSDTEMEAALDQIEKKVVAFANEKQELTKKVESLTTEKTTLASSLATAKTEAETGRTDFANERAARIKDSLDGAIAAGRITAAERATWESRLGQPAQFANELEALGKLDPKVKTGVITVDRNGKKVDIANEAQRTEMINELIAEEIKAGNKTTEAAWAAVERKHPALFGAMKHPKIVMPKR